MVDERPQVVAYRSKCADYPEEPPFHPDRPYPEYTGPIAAEHNNAYESVRACLRFAGLDPANYDSSAWNPLADLIHPGETVMIKPNLVTESHSRDRNGWRYVLTHGSVIRALADYIWKATGPRGTVIVADAPLTDASFGKILRRIGLDRIRDYYHGRGLDFQLIDLRREEWTTRSDVIVSRRQLPGDPRGNIVFDLQDRSEFCGHPGSGRYYGSDYDTSDVNLHHSQGHHEYMIAASAIQCDVLFSIPKLKTHAKAGITVSLKNLVGINGDKNWLPHHTDGDPSLGGDEHPCPDSKHKLERRLVTFFQHLVLRMPFLGACAYRLVRPLGSRIFGQTGMVIRCGTWWGNDTVWRMCLDLNKIILYGNADGTLRAGIPTNRKRHFVLVDGIIAGEGNGPVNPDPVRAGILILGFNAAHVDAASAYLMGFDPDCIPIVRQAFRCPYYPLADTDWREVALVSNRPEWNGLLPAIPDDRTFHFSPSWAWRGHVERSPIQGPTAKSYMPDRS